MSDALRQLHDAANALADSGLRTVKTNDLCAAVYAAIDEIERLNAEVERLEAAIKTQANAVRILDQRKDTELWFLRKAHHEAKVSVKTLDSERKANALLTAEIERLRAEVEEQARLNGMRAERELALRAEIERLRSENARLREALEGVIRIADRDCPEFRAARAALAEKEEKS